MSIDVETDEHVRIITINRPETRNAMDPEHNAALRKAVEDFEADQYTRVAVLTRGGRGDFLRWGRPQTAAPPVPGSCTGRRTTGVELWRLHGHTTQ